MTFDYYFTKQINDSLEIDSIGNCCIQATDGETYLYYLLIKTELGQTKVLEFGPKDVDDITPNFMSCTYKSFEYSEKVVKKIINSFLNAPGRNITQAKETTIDDLKEHYVSLLNYI